MLWGLWVTGTLMEPEDNLWVRCGQLAVHSLSTGYPGSMPVIHKSTANYEQ